MKKFLFTSIAFLAFSGSIMANNADVPRDGLFETNSYTSILKLKETPCQTKAIELYLQYTACTGEDDVDLLNQLMSACV